MPYYKNVSGSTYVQPGDGTREGREIEPDQIVEADVNPAPGGFDEVTTTPEEG